MSDASDLEPPAKRARFEAPSNGALDAPGSPIDDMDDDFYDTSPVKPSSSLIGHVPEAIPLPSPAAPSSANLSTMNIPGLGTFNNTYTATPQSPPAKHADNSLEADSIEQADHSGGLEMNIVGAGLNDQHLQEEVTAAAQLEEALSAALAADDTDEPNQSQLQEQVLPNVNRHLEIDAQLPLPTSNVPESDLISKPSTNNTGANEQHTVSEPPLTEVEASHAREDAKADFLQAAQAIQGDPAAEWQLDSSDAASSNDSSSSDDSDDDSSDEGEVSDEGELLDPEEQVRILMMESADEPGTNGKTKVKTMNESSEVYTKPDIVMTEKTKITQLGIVESIVDDLVVIKANVSGDYQVLESGSALCLDNRTVIGKVSETMGRVQEPRYSVGFADPSEIATLGIAKDTPIYYVDDYSTFVFTEPLRAQKYTDASNLHDEETGDVEFSDDEKEAEHKKRLKEAKKAKIEGKSEAQETVSRPSHADAPMPSQPSHYQGGGLHYSDDDDEDLGMYKPLSRPTHFEDVVGAGAPIEDRSHVRRGAMRGRGGWPDRGRGFRGRGGGPPTGPRGGPPTGPRGNRGDRFPRGSERSERRGGRQEPNRPRHPPQQDRRSASSASPNRRNHGKHPQQSPPRGNSGGRNKRRRIPSPVPASAAPASTIANAHGQNSSMSSAGWSMPSSSVAYQQANSYPTANTPPIPAGAYVNPAFYTQQGTPQAQQNQQQQQQQPQQNLAQWAQWLQLAAAMSQQGHGHGQPVSQPNQAPPAPPPPSHGQNSTPSLQDILRTLGGGPRPS